MGWWHDIRHALRAISRMPGLATVVVLSLGVGIGVNTTCFSWMQAVLTHPIPGVSGGARFDSIEPTTDAGLSPGASWLEFVDLRSRLTSFNDVAAFRMAPFNVGEAPRNERTYGMFVSGNYFDVLGLTPQHGRLLTAADTARAGAEPVVVLSDSYWRAHYNSDPNVVGQRLQVSGRDLTIVGVAPPRFQGTVLGLAFDLFAPATIAPVLLESRELDDRRVRGYSMLGALKPGTSLAHAQADVDAAMRELAAAYPQTNATMGAEVLPFWKALRGPQRLFLPALILLQAILLLLLLVVCANVATLVLARASARTREVSVRLTLGAGTLRVLRLILTESILLALAGASLGMLIASWGTNALRAIPVIGAFPIRFQTDLDVVSLLAAALLGILTGLAFGAPAAWQLARMDPMRALRSGAFSSASSVTRHVLMGVQVALAGVVLVAAGIFLRSATSHSDVDPGFKRDGLLLAAYDLSGRPTDIAAARRFALGVLAQLERQPNIQSAAIATAVPLDLHGLPARSFALDGRPVDPVRPERALANVVTSGYFRTMGIPLRSGTDFVGLDDATTSSQAIVNEEFVARFLESREPIGRRLTIGDKTYAIVGVVANSVYEAFDEPKKAAIYLSFRDWPSTRAEIHARTRDGAESALGPIVARAVRDVDPSLPVYDVRTLNEHIERNLFLKRIPARMFAVLAPLLLALAAIGIYGVVSYSVGQRRAEIGIRLALGATPRRVVADVVADNLKIIGAGVIGGWLIALLGVFRLSPESGIDWVVFVVVPATLLVVGATACWLPSRRAAKISPMLALKQA